MKHSLILLLIAPLVLAHCVSTSPSLEPEGTGEHKDGYDLGRSDAVKQQYWLVQNLQKQPKPTLPKVAYLPIEIPGTTTNGITTVPHQERICIQQ